MVVDYVCWVISKFVDRLSFLKGFCIFFSDFQIKFCSILVDFYGIVVDSSEFSSYVDDFLQIFGDLKMNSGRK